MRICSISVKIKLEQFSGDRASSTDRARISVGEERRHSRRNSWKLKSDEKNQIHFFCLFWITYPTRKLGALSEKEDTYLRFHR